MRSKTINNRKFEREPDDSSETVNGNYKFTYFQSFCDFSMLMTFLCCGWQPGEDCLTGT